MSVTRRQLASAALVAVLAILGATRADAAPRTDPRGAFHVYDTPSPPAGPGEKVVALSFDDGPHPTYTPRILEVLAHYGVRATFFEIGREAEKHPEIVRQVVAQGNVIGNHTWDHVDLRGLDDARFAAEVDHTTEVLQAASGQRIVCLRPPYGRSDPTVIERLTARGLTSVLWTADSQDFEKPGVGAIVDNALRGLQPGGVILMHDGGGNRDQTIAALPTIIERIQAAGYRIVPMCAPDAHTPAGGLMTAHGEQLGRITVTGWGADPDTPDPMDVHLYLDGTFAQAVKASIPGTPGPQFSATLRAHPGHHEVCAYAINVGEGAGNPSLGCLGSDVPHLTQLDDLRPLVGQLRFEQLREEAIVVRRVALVHDTRRLPWDVGRPLGLGRSLLGQSTLAR